MKVQAKVILTVSKKEGDVIQTPFGPKTLSAADAESGYYTSSVVAVSAADSEADPAQLQAVANQAANELESLLGTPAQTFPVISLKTQVG